MSTIELRVPAQADFVGLVRNTATAVIARTELSVDELADWTLCISEAFNLVINHHPVHGDVHVQFRVAEGGVRIAVTGPSGSSLETLNSSDISTQLAWTILNSVPESVETAISDDGAITLTLVSAVVASA